MKIFSNLAISLDGKIATRKRELFLLGSSADHQEMQRLRKLADVVLVGASTLRGYRKPNLIYRSTKQPVNALLSSRLEGISPSWPFFKEPKTRKILFVGPDCSPQKARSFEKFAEIIPLQTETQKRPTSIQVVKHLENLGFKSLLIEGGGGVMWDFVKSNLIQTYFVTLTPRIIGGVAAPTLVDGHGFLAKNILNLKLKKCRVVGNEIFLEYQTSK